MPRYSDEFQTAWRAYHATATIKEKSRSGKTAAYIVWRRRKLDGHLPNVLARIKGLRDTYSPGYLPGMQVYLKLHDFRDPPPAAAAAPGSKEIPATVRVAIAKERRLSRVSAALRPRIEARAAELFKQQSGRSYVDSYREAEREIRG